MPASVEPSLASTSPDCTCSLSQRMAMASSAVYELYPAATPPQSIASQAATPDTTSMAIILATRLGHCDSSLVIQSPTAIAPAPPSNAAATDSTMASRASMPQGNVSA